MKYYDLTMSIDENTPVFPGDAKPEIAQSGSVKEGGYNTKKLTIGSHFGTHIDVPYHMLEDGKKLTDFPIEKFIGQGVVIRLEDKMSLVGVKEGDIVFFFTGHTDKAHKKEFFENNPTISKEIALELVKRKINIVGIDSYTPDNYPYEVHKIFLKQDILIVENLVGLKPLVGKRAIFHILPLKIKDGDGAPCRVVAELG
ncbi:cyclase family protein [Candidatus Micrarchaeota archaeon]|nr:cyclase family protein [Candidatus Micrarchaeota archaeon]